MKGRGLFTFRKYDLSKKVNLEVAFCSVSIRDILRQIRILGCVHWLSDLDLDLDSDPSLSVNFFPKLYLLIKYCRYGLHQSSKVTSR
jgi:hypothetical protein